MSQENIVNESSSAVEADCSAQDLMLQLADKIEAWARLDDQNRGAILITADEVGVYGAPVGRHRVLVETMTRHLMARSPIREIIRETEAEAAKQQNTIALAHDIRRKQRK